MSERGLRMAAAGLSATVRSYRSYLLLILVPYLFLIFMFHTQLQMYDADGRRSSGTDVLGGGPGGMGVGGVIIFGGGGGGGEGSDFAAQSYHVRSLRIKNASGPDEANLVHASRDRQHIDRRRFAHVGGAKELNVTHDVVVQHGEEAMYYKSDHRQGGVASDMDDKSNSMLSNRNKGDTLVKHFQQRPLAVATAPSVGQGGSRLQHSDRGRWHRKLSRQGLPHLGMNTSELLHSLMQQAGVHTDKDNLYVDAQWPHCRRMNIQEESIEYRLSQHQQQEDGAPGIAGGAGDAGLTPGFPGGVPPLPKLEALRFQPISGNYFYSAFYDDREPEAAYIRVIALLKKGARPALFCHFLSSSLSGDGGGGDFRPVDPLRPERVFTSMLTYYEMCENHAKDFGGWILTCEVPSLLEPAPCEVTVSVHSTYSPGKPGSVRLPVMLLRGPPPPSTQLEFGICVPPLFGYIPSTTLIEFVELTKILGARHFVFYAHQIPREIRKVLRYYERIGTATVIPWELPVSDKAIWYHGQLLAINDCLYRSMHRFRYVAFNDIDEFVVPHGRHGNWSDMMRHLEEMAVNAAAADVGGGAAGGGAGGKGEGKYAGFSFQSAFFDPLLESSSRVLYDLESDLRTKSFSKVRTKVMVRADRIHELGIHHISKPVADAQRTLYVEPDVAFLHHYRKCVTDFDPRMNCQVFARDESLSRYIPTLRHNVHQTMWILKEADKPGQNLDLLLSQGRT